jgi:lambda repressor-like predicted transcriptional regulator
MSELPPAQIRAIHAEIAEAELWFYREIKKAESTEAYDQALCGFVFEVSFAHARALFNSALELDWPASEVQLRIEQTTTSVIDECFDSKHYYRSYPKDRFYDWKAGFRMKMQNAIRQSDEWGRVLEKVAELALWQAENQSSSPENNLQDREESELQKNRSAYPRRAQWLQARLLERGWSSYELSQRSGLHKNTIKKMLEGQRVGNAVLQLILTTLSTSGGTVGVLDMPND